MASHPAQQQLFAVVFIKLSQTDVAHCGTQAWKSVTTAAESGAARRASRNGRSAKRWANSERICRCSSVACSGTNKTKSKLTGRPSGESKGTGLLRRRKAPAACLRPLIRPCGNGDTLAEASGAEFFAGKQAVKNDRAGESEMALEKHAGLFKDPLFAAGIQIK
jgi:hypothetical protein